MDRSVLWSNGIEARYRGGRQELPPVCGKAYTEVPSVSQENARTRRVEMTEQSAAIVRKPRADAVRNRERVLEAAKAVFSAGGVVASLEAVARRAGVGIGTLYRHFPTREALYEAVYRREVEHLVELAKHLVETKIAPVEALPAGCGPASNASRRKRAWRRRSPWRRTVPRTLRPI